MLGVDLFVDHRKHFTGEVMHDLGEVHGYQVVVTAVEQTDAITLLDKSYVLLDQLTDVVATPAIGVYEAGSNPPECLAGVLLRASLIS